MKKMMMKLVYAAAAASIAWLARKAVAALQDRATGDAAAATTA